MRKGLVEDRRRQCFLEIAGILEAASATASVVVSDVQAKPATGAPTAEADVVRMIWSASNIILSRTPATAS